MVISETKIVLEMYGWIVLPPSSNEFASIVHQCGWKGAKEHPGAMATHIPYINSPTLGASRSSGVRVSQASKIAYINRRCSVFGCNEAFPIGSM